MDVKALIERLRTRVDPRIVQPDILAGEAADALEALTSRLEAMQAGLARTETGANKEIRRLEAELAEARATVEGEQQKNLAEANERADDLFLELASLSAELADKDRDETERELVRLDRELAEERKRSEDERRKREEAENELAALRPCAQPNPDYEFKAKFEAAREGWADAISDGDDAAALKCVDGWIEERLAR